MTSVLNRLNRLLIQWMRVLSFLLLALPITVFAIDTPPNPRGTVIDGSTILWEWNWVPGVTRYEVTVDGQVVTTTPDPRYTSTNLWQGDHSMRVRALDTNGQYSAHTETIKVILGAAPVNNAPTNTGSPGDTPNNDQSITSGWGAPSNPRGTQTGSGTVRWEWNSVSGASNYEVTVDGSQFHTTSNTFHTSENLWIGEHSMHVKAIDNNWRYSEQSATAKINVVDQNNTPAPVVQNDPANNPPPQNDNGLIDPQSWNMTEVYQKDGYELVFSDEFNGYSLNPARWRTQLRWDGEFNGERYEYRVINGEDQFYVNTFAEDGDHRDFVVPQHNPFEFNGSRLAIRAIRNPLKNRNTQLDHGPLRDIVAQQTFLSGALTTYDKFHTKYGYFEARIKIPSHEGSFPAFWLHHQNTRSQGTQRTEIDIMENLGHAPWFIYNSFHYFTNVSTNYGGDDHFIKPTPSGQIYTGTDYSQDWHTYAVEWEPGHVTWFIDGQKVSEVWNGQVDRENLYIILNLAIGGNWTNYPTSSGGLGRASWDHYPNDNDINQFQNPALEIDYVRAYKRR